MEAEASHLLVAANGALSQLPLAVLPTFKITAKQDAKLPYAQFRDVPWLIRQAAFIQLPSVNALLALRRLPAANAQRSPFIGFGDPQFGTEQLQIASTRGLRNLGITRSSQKDVDADWVVLSACNTAAGDGQGADALSGLGRGFFYAGSRALLVTHWPVESASARLLVVGIFERQAADAKLSRAEALRQSMLALMQQKSASPNFAYAHPLFWAPYALVGEGEI